eukprot:TRINITY_DN658_c4_g1_i1.p1 TRINITY_DN658_c4_g1~~TRINITY_DN658_c4_g1_i1.p1  ORF type:complete len:434 (+),score=131.01 TRINITY_DN658_c4_g1_i1:80-1303(+)
MPLSVSVSPSLGRAPSVSLGPVHSLPRPSAGSAPRGEHASRQRSLPNFYVAGAASPEPLGYGSGSESESESGGTQPPPRSPSANIPRPPVHEVLIQKGKLYNQRREALQEEARRQEQLGLQSKPKISRRAQDKVYSLGIVERTYQRAAQRQRDLEQARLAAAQAEADEAARYTFRPRITRRGRAATGRAASAGAVDRRRPKRRAADEPSPEDLAECNFHPLINARSEELAERQRRRLGVPQHSGPSYTHWDSLLERHKMARLEAARKWREQEEEAQPHQPKISQYAASLSPSRLVARNSGGSPRRRRRQPPAEPPLQQPEQPGFLIQQGAAIAAGAAPLATWPVPGPSPQIAAGLSPYLSPPRRGGSGERRGASPPPLGATTPPRGASGQPAYFDPYAEPHAELRRR